jgi:hypothetical protein
MTKLMTNRAAIRHALILGAASCTMMTPTGDGAGGFSRMRDCLNVALLDRFDETDR